VELGRGIALAVAATTENLRAAAKPVTDPSILSAVANISASGPELGGLVAEAFDRVGAKGIISTDYGNTIETTLNVVDGMSFERGYISHHMVTDLDAMRAVVENPYIVLTDIKLTQPAQLDAAKAIAAEDDRPLVIIAEETSPEVLLTLLGKDGPGKYLVVHPPEFGKWRRAMMEDLAIITGGKVLARDLGDNLQDITREHLGSSDRVEATSENCIVVRGHGPEAQITARKAQVQRLYDIAPPNVDKDKLHERLAKLCGGTATIFAGGVTPVEQKRTIQLIEDSLNAVRAAAEEGVLVGGGVIFLRVAALLDKVAASVEGDARKGVELVQSVLSLPLARIAFNAGAEPNEVVRKVSNMSGDEGYNARTGAFENLIEAGVIDPVRVTCAALMNAGSVATLILTTETLVADLAEDEDPTAARALGGGAENLGRE
jgi:chaperonin GroEL